jgi:NAD(P)-dependent dehydrogenase (short-subunit alcohol dehydrogenase family)
MIKKAIVIGASGGIGSSLSRQLSAQGWDLTLVARTGDPLEKLAQELNASYQVVDLTDGDQIRSLFENLEVETETHLAVIVAVGSIPLKPAHLTSLEDWEATLRLNLTGPFYVIREAIKNKKAKELQFLFFSSAAAHVGLKNHEAIGASKAGLEGLVRSAAATYARQNIRFNAVALGLVDTPLAKRLVSNPASLQASENLHALGRIGNADEVARFTANLLDPSNSWLTGQIIGLDGGLSRLRA